MGNLCSLSWEGPHIGAGKWVWGVLVLGRKEWQWTQRHSPFPCTTGREEVEEVWSEVKLGKKGRVRRNFFKVWFYFSLFYSVVFFGKKLDFFAHIEPVLFVMVSGGWSPPSLSLLLWFFSPVHLREWQSSCGGLLVSCQVNPPHSACKSSTGLLSNHSFPVCPDTGGCPNPCAGLWPWPCCI